MKILLTIFFFVSFLSVSAQTFDSGLFQPIIPNKIPDKFISSEYKNIEGFLGYRLNINLEKRLLQIDSATLLSGFRNRPGSQTWIGEHMGKFLFSSSKTYHYSNDQRLKILMDTMVKQYISYQMPDGYLGTYLTKDRWKDWDVWAHKYAIIGLLNYYSVTGYQPALDAAKRAADLICTTFGDGKGKLNLMDAGFHEGLAPGSILEPMVDLYRYTGDQKYLDFCRYILRAFESADGPKIFTNLSKYKTVTMVGDAKAYEMLSCLLGILKYYKLTGDEKYLTLMQTAWNDIASRRLYITGTASDHEIFQDQGDLMAGNDNDMGEGCVTVTWIQFNLSLLQITGEEKYASQIEKSVYNHLLAAENPQTGCVSYYTALQGAKPYKCDQGYSCCLSSVPRGISLIPEMLAGKINNIFSVLMIAPGNISDSIIADDGTKVALKIQCQSAFPLDGAARYIVNPSEEKSFTINFRVPSWSKNFTAIVDGKIYQGNPNQYLSIKKIWAKKDVIKIHFDMPVEILNGGNSYPNRIAFKRGPQVLAVDSILNTSISSLNKIFYENVADSLMDATKYLPVNWSWKQAYETDLFYQNKKQPIVLVPFSETSQLGSNTIVWIRK